MKIQLDTTNKSIKIEEKINLKELMETLEKLLPNELWKEFTIETVTITNLNIPQIIVQKQFINPWNPPYITYQADNSTPLLEDGNYLFNIE